MSEHVHPLGLARPLSINRRPGEGQRLGLPTLLALALAVATVLSLLYLAQTSGVAIL